MYLNGIMHDTAYDARFFGHYHDNATIPGKHCLLYEQRVRIC